MRNAFHKANDQFEDGVGESPDIQWAAMLAKAPKPPALGTAQQVENGKLRDCNAALIELLGKVQDEMQSNMSMSEVFYIREMIADGIAAAEIGKAVP
ncbi:hypothetical protein DAH51_22490 [Sphingobium yanoikuyae]|uniref:Uncharacterized protein n=2 Tax=Sphingobium yanoikuyae TaxID=13690 RepID=A0A430BIU5_SPHYA|nr:hypothetical protein DAH51_22490 [Sphingobium yanoikuyae]